MLDQILAITQPAIEEILATILVALATALTVTIRRYVGVRAEAVMRAALDEAIQRGVQASSAETPAEIAREAVEYVKRGLPDTLKALGARDDVLADRAYIAAKQKGA